MMQRIDHAFIPARGCALRLVTLQKGSQCHCTEAPGGLLQKGSAFKKVVIHVKYS
jgi:hypothetical protein